MFLTAGFYKCSSQELTMIVPHSKMLLSLMCKLKCFYHVPGCCSEGRLTGGSVSGVCEPCERGWSRHQPSPLFPIHCSATAICVWAGAKEGLTDYQGRNILSFMLSCVSHVMSEGSFYMCFSFLFMCWYLYSCVMCVPHLAGIVSVNVKKTYKHFWRFYHHCCTDKCTSLDYVSCENLHGLYT